MSNLNVGDLCVEQSDPRTVITYTMDDGPNWWNYEVHYEDGEQVDVYVNSWRDKKHASGQRIFRHKENTWLFRLESVDFEDEMWKELTPSQNE